MGLYTITTAHHVIKEVHRLPALYLRFDTVFMLATAFIQCYPSIAIKLVSLSHALQQVSCYSSFWKQPEWTLLCFSLSMHSTHRIFHDFSLTIHILLMCAVSWSMTWKNRPVWSKSLSVFYQENHTPETEQNNKCLSTFSEMVWINVHRLLFCF